MVLRFRYHPCKDIKDDRFILKNSQLQIDFEIVDSSLLQQKGGEFILELWNQFDGKKEQKSFKQVLNNKNAILTTKIVNEVNINYIKIR